MRPSARLGLERRLAAAEDVVAKRAMARAAALLRAEIDGMPVERSYPIMVAIKRASESGAEPRDAVRVLLTEIATVDTALAVRIGRAVGIEIKG
jgi:hypothetical protein